MLSLDLEKLSRWDLITGMEIARIRHLFYPDMPHDYFYELSAQQAKYGNEVHVFTWNKLKSKYGQKIAVDGFTIHRLRGFNFSFYGLVQDYPYLPTLRLGLETLKPDVIHAESHLFLPSIQALRMAKKSKIPYVVTIHGVSANRGTVLNLAQKTYIHTVSNFFRNVNRIVCLTKNDQAEIIKYGFPDDKIRLIPNAVDVERFKPIGNREDNLVVWVGRFVPEKGLEFLIEAARIVSKNFPDAKFLLIGYGPLKMKIVRLALHYGLLGTYVNFRGNLSRDEIAQVMGKASIFVFPSLKEGMPVSVLEAIACEVPVVGFNISGVSDIIEDGKSGFLVPLRNVAALAQAIMNLLGNKKLRRTLGHNARQSAIQKYRWSIVLQALTNVYLEAINDSKFN